MQLKHTSSSYRELLLVGLRTPVVFESRANSIVEVLLLLSLEHEQMPL